MAETAKWYVVHTYSGYENTVMATIEKTVETRQLQDIIQQVSIPMETVTEVTEKGPKTYDRKVFPGYVLVKMVMTDDAWYIIKKRTGCASPFPCSAAKRRSSWSSIRWSSPPTDPGKTWEGFSPPEIRVSVLPHSIWRCLSWHRK